MNESTSDTDDMGWTIKQFDGMGVTNFVWPAKVKPNVATKSVTCFLSNANCKVHSTRHKADIFQTFQFSKCEAVLASSSTLTIHIITTGPKESLCIETRSKRK